MSYDPAQPYQGANPYAAARKQATDTAQGAGQQSIDAITRRYAAMGNLNSGSYTKALENTGRDTTAATENAVGGINMQEAQNASGLQEAERQRQFQGGLQNQQLTQQQGQFNQELPLKQRQLDLEASQQALDAHANDLNYQLGQYQEDHSGGLLGGGGFLGTGFGGSGTSGGGRGSGFGTWASAGMNQLF